MKLMNRTAGLFLIALAATANAVLAQVGPAVTGLANQGRIAPDVKPIVDTLTDRTDPKARDDETQGGVSGDPCSTSGESCCEAHSSPGCEDSTCCNAVCEVSGLVDCCRTGWTAACAANAFFICGAKCEAEVCADATGSCCEDHPTPGCEDSTCCNAVCEVPGLVDCCRTGWTAACAASAESVCVTLCTGACCEQNGCTQTTPDDCTTVNAFQGLGTECKPDQACCFGDGSCEDLAPVCCVEKGGTPSGASTSCAANCCTDADCPPDPSKCFDSFCDLTNNTCKRVFIPDCRVNASEKGSILYYSGLEVGFSPAATTAGPGFALSKDTFITLVNDLNREVCVEWHFVNGDPPLAAIPGIERAHPGWNSYDCVTCLTPHENVFMSLARGGGSLGCQPLTGLDPGTPPGRPDPDGLPGDRIIRGYAIAFAVDPDGNPISWNHLSGHVDVVDYRNRSAWEYNTYAFPCVILQPTPGLPCGTDPTTLSMDGLEYALAWDRILFDFYAVTSTAFSRLTPATPVTLDTALTLYPVSVDLRPNSTNTSGPVLTRADIVIWNENEDDRTGTSRCIDCWDQTLLSNYDAPNNFLIELLNTNKGYARINGVKSDSCDAPGSCCCRQQCSITAADCENSSDCPVFQPGPTQRIQTCGLFNCFDPDCTQADFIRGTPDRDCSENAALLGLSDKILTFPGGRTDAGMTLVAIGTQPAAIRRTVIPPTAPLKEEKRTPREGSR